MDRQNAYALCSHYAANFRPFRYLAWAEGRGCASLHVEGCEFDTRLRFSTYTVCSFVRDQWYVLCGGCWAGWARCGGSSAIVLQGHFIWGLLGGRREDPSVPREARTKAMKITRLCVDAGVVFDVSSRHSCPLTTMSGLVCQHPASAVGCTAAFTLRPLGQRGVDAFVSGSHHGSSWPE